MFYFVVVVFWLFQMIPMARHHTIVHQHFPSITSRLSDLAITRTGRIATRPEGVDRGVWVLVWLW